MSSLQEDLDKQPNKAALQRALLQMQKTLNAQGRLIKRHLQKPMPAGFVKMNEVLKPVKSGEVWIDRFRISEQDAMTHNIRVALAHQPEHAILPGDYTKLVVNDRVMMSDVTMEMTSNVEVITKARGQVFIAGLGMGMILIPILRNRKVKHVIVAERNNDVIKIVIPQLRDYLEPWAFKKLTLANVDVFAVVPTDVKYDAIYFDIWPAMSSDNWPEMKLLRSNFHRALKKGGWMGAWMQDQCRRRWLKIRRAERLRMAPVGGNPLQKLTGSLAEYAIDDRRKASRRSSDQG